MPAGDILRLLVVDDLPVAGCPGGGRRRRRGPHGLELHRAAVAVHLADFARPHGQGLAVQALDLGRAGAYAEARRILAASRPRHVVALLLQRDRAARRDDLVGPLRCPSRGSSRRRGPAPVAGAPFPSSICDMSSWWTPPSGCACPRGSSLRAFGSVQMASPVVSGVLITPPSIRPAGRRGRKRSRPRKRTADPARRIVLCLAPLTVKVTRDAPTHRPEASSSCVQRLRPYGTSC